MHPSNSSLCDPCPLRRSQADLLDIRRCPLVLFRCGDEIMEEETRLQAEVRPSAIRTDPSGAAEFSGRDCERHEGQMLEREPLRALLSELQRQGRVGVARRLLALHARRRPEDGTIWSQVGLLGADLNL
eukprot:scaffold320638_cov46-Prasinocladus_malaysianus.AAC.2